MPFLIMERYTRDFIRKNRRWAFVFGDNMQRTGLGGQAAEARGEPNAIGIATKYSPSEFFTDTEAEMKTVWNDFYPVTAALCRNCIVVFPKDGIGTGRAELSERAPNVFGLLRGTYQALAMRYAELYETDDEFPFVEPPFVWRPYMNDDGTSA